MRNKPIQADQLIPTSSTPPPEAGFYRIDRHTIGVVGNMSFRDPNTQVMTSAVTVNTDPVTVGDRVTRLSAGSQFVPVEMKYKRSTVAIVGDSFAVREKPEAGPAWFGRRNMTGLFYWTNIILGARFQVIYASGENGTVPGTWVTNGSIDAALATYPDYLWLTGDADGGGTSATTADYIGWFTDIFNRASAAGARVIVHLLPPSTSLATAAVRLRTQQVNAWLAYTAPLNWDVVPMNLAAATLASASLTYQPESTNLTDGTHYTCPGAFQAAIIAARILDPLIPKWNPPWIEMYDLASGGETAFLPSPLMFGTGGGLSVLTSSTGVPAGFVASITAGESGTVNTSARTDGETGNWLDYAVTFTAANKRADLYANQASLSGKTVGDYVEFFAEMKIDPATAARIRSFYFYIEFRSAGTKYATGGDIGNIPTKDWGLASFTGKTASDIYIMHTDKIQIPAGSTHFNVSIGINSAGAGTCNFSIGRITLK